MLEKPSERARTRAKEELERTKHSVRAEIGRFLVNFVEEYFPDQSRKNSARGNWTLLVVGLIFGIYLTRRLTR